MAPAYNFYGKTNILFTATVILAYSGGENIRDIDSFIVHGIIET